MIPRPITPTFLCVGSDVDAMHSIEAGFTIRVPVKMATGNAEIHNENVEGCYDPYFVELSSF
jgi:hypothetical protein